ncbi:MAG: SUMF1/EgtB/PvdO family nonheme iron enzyme [Polyangiales bacterium]
MADAQTTGAQQTAAIGTPLWMAPEQTDASAAIAPACDVWALGLIAFFMLTGRVYWRAANMPNGSAAALLREIVLDSIEPASARAALLATARSLPIGFDEWFARCVARDPAARFPNARAARSAFETLSMGSSPSPIVSSHVVSSGANSSANSSPMTSAPTTPVMSSPPLMSAPTTPAHAVSSGFGPAGTLASPSPEHAAQRAPSPGVNASAPLPSYTEYAGQTAPTGANLRAVPDDDDDAPVAPAAGSKGMMLGMAAVAIALVGITWAMVDHGSPRPTSTTGPAPIASPSSSHVAPSIVVCPSGMFYVRGGNVLGPSGSSETAPGVCVDATEVTVEAYEQCVGKKACAATTPIGGETFCNAGRKERARHPINCVSFDDASAYCGAMGKRLPTTVEWIRASHGGDRETAYPWGENASGSEACSSASEHRDVLGTCEVGSHTMGSSGLGVQDLGGNVAEWSDDAASGKHFIGGGSWRDGELAFGKDAAGRLLTPLSQVQADHRAATIGFRCASTPPPR